MNKKKNLYLISRPYTSHYDQYDSAIVCAESAAKAKLIHPNGENTRYDGTSMLWHSSWVHPDKVTVTKIGEASSRTAFGVVLASFNAG